MPYADDGGTSWNATRCRPVALEPNAVGDSCTVQQSSTSGIDDCDATSMCFDVDVETNVGTCVSLCQGTPPEPTCPNACDVCPISATGTLAVCFQTCDPLDDDCPDGEGCYPTMPTSSASRAPATMLGCPGEPASS